MLKKKRKKRRKSIDKGGRIYYNSTPQTQRAVERENEKDENI